MIFDTTQVPIQEPMYVNGHLSQVWHMFFYQLSRVASIDNEVDLTDITQLTHQLPPQAIQGQMLIDLALLRGHNSPIVQQLDQKESQQPLQAVFLCPDQPTPLANISINNQTFTPVASLQSSEVIHDPV